MVIIPTTSTDGHSQPVAITGQEGQDPDEPPIPRPSSSAVEEVKLKQFPIAEEIDIGTASNSVIDIESHDGLDSGARVPFDGDANTAHIHDSKVVVAFLEVDVQYVLSPVDFGLN